MTASEPQRPPKIPGVRWTRKTRARTGEVYFLLYYRKTNTRLPDDWTSLEFRRALAAAAKEKPRPRSVRELVRSYVRAPEWTQLAQSTRNIEFYMIKTIVEDFGGMPLSFVEQKGSRRIFKEWHHDLGEERGLRAADMRMGRLQTIFKFGCDQESIERNPIATFKRLYHVDRSMVIWTPEHFAKFNAVAGVEMKLAAFLALHTGQRRGDLMALTWGQYDGSGISLVQSKTKQRIYVPATKALKETLDSLLDLRLAEHRAKLIGHNGGPALDATIHDHHIMLSASGNPHTPDTFGEAWHRAFLKSGIGTIRVDGKEFDLHFHDIRGTTVTMLAESGATIPEIASITGHKMESAHRILERYLGRSRTLATAAIAKLEMKLIAR